MTAGMGQGAAETGPVAPATHLGASILVTLFCCLPFGAIAIVYGLLAKSRASAGNYDAADHASDMAEKWMFAGCGAAVLILLGNVIYRVAIHFM